MSANVIEQLVAADKLKTRAEVGWPRGLLAGDVQELLPCQRWHGVENSLGRRRPRGEAREE